MTIMDTNTTTPAKTVTLDLNPQQIALLRRGLFVLKGQIDRSGNVSPNLVKEVEDLGNLLATTMA